MTDLEKRYQLALDQGHSAAWDKEWDRAASFYKQALEEKPGDSKAQTNLALALYELKEYPQALQLYQRVAQKTPKDPVPLEKIARIYEILNKPGDGSKFAVKAAERYLGSGDVEKAIENWSRAAALNPESLAAHSRLAVVYERMRKTPQAVREYLHIASLMQHLGQLDKAVQVVNRALMLSPDHPEASQALGMLRDGDMLPKPTNPRGGAAPVQQPASQLLSAPEEEEIPKQTPIQEAGTRALSDLAELFFEQSIDDGEAPNQNKRGLKSIVDGTANVFSKNVDKTKLMLHLGQAVEILSREDYDQAAVELKQLTEIGLHHPAAYFLLGKIRADNNRLESALRYLRRSVSHLDYALGSRLLIAGVLRKKDQIKAASIESLEALKFADSELVIEEQADGLRQLYDPIIEAHDHSSDEEYNLKLYDTIAELLNQPRWRQDLKKIRGELETSNGTPRPIAEVLTEASSSQVVVALSTIKQLARKGRRHAAFEEALFALQGAPTYLPLHIAIGEILLSGNKTQAAIDKFLVVARYYNIRGETRRAIQMIRRVVDLSPLDLQARQLLIDQLVSGGYPEDAFEEYLKMAEVYYNLAELAEAREKYSEALRFAERNSLGENNRVRVLHRIADIDVQSLNWRNGLSIYQQICRVQPGDFEANLNLIDLNFRLGESKQAFSAIRNFLQILDTQDRQDESIPFLERLADSWPQQAMIKFLLAEQYQSLGRIEAAVDEYDNARAIYYDAGDKSGAIRMLEKLIALNPPNVEEYQRLLEDIRSG